MRLATSKKCRCGNTAGKKISPKTKQKVCKRCYKKDLFTKKKKKGTAKPINKKQPTYPVRKSKVLLPTYKGFEGTRAKEFCDSLRENQTSAEDRFKFMFGLTEIPFCPQYPIRREDDPTKYYILDFYMPTENLVVEIDGGYHEAPEKKVDDKVRDEFLKRKGFRVVRITNRVVFKTKTVRDLRRILGIVTKLG